MSNHLKNQSSPYLLQHAENPVDWYPWCEEAFRRAKAENKPVFLSIGYSTCHWCHVMARESFEDYGIADILNRYFISVKVDREERPDIDSVYMSVCQALTGSGGWPMSIFMTADQNPFFAGTYFPPSSRNGMIGFRELLYSIAGKWKEEAGSLSETAQDIVRQIRETEEQAKGIDLGTRVPDDSRDKIDGSLAQKAVKLLTESFDAAYGGFGEAPKFPMPHNLLFLMLYGYLSSDKAKDGQKDVFLEQEEKKREQILGQVKTTLEQMRRGGIFDQIGYGFSRYSTDRLYLVPHFEKMLYDNALLIIAYALAYRVYGETVFLDTAEKTAAYVLREMTGEEGEFYSAQDADSEGEEGKFYLWSLEEVCEVLGEKKGREFARYYYITKQGNFEGKNIPNLLSGSDITDRFCEERERLYQYRAARTKLHLDDKALTAWNGLMICAMAVLYRITGKQTYLSAAIKAEKFIAKYLTEGNILYVGCRSKVRLAKGFLDEYAYMAAAYLSLFDATADPGWLNHAKEICKEAAVQFGDEKGGYFLYGTMNSSLIMRPKETYDGALPSGNSVMAYCLVRLSQLLPKEDEESVEKQMAFLAKEAADYPAGHCMFLIALLYRLYPPQKITVVLDGTKKKEQITARMPVYADVAVMTQETGEYPLLNHQTTYYVCKNHTCLPPANEAPKSLGFL